MRTGYAGAKQGVNYMEEMVEIEETKKVVAKHKAEELIEAAASTARELIDEAREQALELIAKAVTRAKQMLEEEEALVAEEEADAKDELKAQIGQALASLGTDDPKG